MSFWHVALENFPEGRFQRRNVDAAIAASLVSQARLHGRLRAASIADLLAPWGKRDRQKYEDLCAALQRINVDLALPDFFGRSCVNPLNLFKVGPSVGLLVVNCGYTFDPPSRTRLMNDEDEELQERAARLRDDKLFAIEPSSITFSLFEM